MVTFLIRSLIQLNSDLEPWYAIYQQFTSIFLPHHANWRGAGLRVRIIWIRIRLGSGYIIKKIIRIQRSPKHCFQEATRLWLHTQVVAWILIRF